MEISNKMIIENIKTKTTHVVDLIEDCDGCMIIFTVDGKCFPIEDVRQINNEVDDLNEMTDENSWDYFVSELKKHKLTDTAMSDEEYEKYKKGKCSESKSITKKVKSINIFGWEVSFSKSK